MSAVGAATEAEVTRLVLVRHGEARAAVDGVVGGHAGCGGLSELGRHQAGRLRDRLVAAGFRPDVVATSVLPRAVETATILGDGLGHPVDRILRTCELCEMHPGEGDGLDWDEFATRYGRWDPMDFPERPLSPGGESMAGFVERASAAVRQVAEEHRGRTVLVACHGGVIMAATATFLGVAPSWFYEGIRNTSVTEWVRRGEGPWLLTRFNDAAHLEDLAAGSGPAALVEGDGRAPVQRG